MLDLIAPFFRQLYERTGLNFIVFYEPYEFGRFVNGAAISLKLIFWSLAFSLVIGVLGAWVQGARSKVLRVGVNAYIQAFRNTPPMIQLLFFYFGLGAFTPSVDMGGYSQPLISVVRMGDHLARHLRRRFQHRDLSCRSRGCARNDA